MTALPSVSFKDGAAAAEFDQLRPKLQMILNEMGRFCELSGHRFVLTDLLSSAADDARLGRVSNSHREGRAADVSVKGWPEEFTAHFMAWFAKLYGKEGAVSKSDGVQRLIVRHNIGHGDHLHVQVKA